MIWYDDDDDEQETGHFSRIMFHGPVEIYATGSVNREIYWAIAVPSYAHATDTVAEYDVVRLSALSSKPRCLYGAPVSDRHAETHLTATTNGQTYYWRRFRSFRQLISVYTMTHEPGSAAEAGTRRASDAFRDIRRSIQASATNLGVACDCTIAHTISHSSLTNNKTRSAHNKITGCNRFTF